MGREAVMTALTTAAMDLLVEEGMQVSVREIAARAGVNHGLVHTYFGSKQALIAAALDEMNERAADEADPSGFPPPDLASRRGGKLGKAVARIRLEAGSDLFTSHPITRRWTEALAQERPELSGDEIELMVITASAMGLGWAVFGDHLSDVFGYDGERRAALDQHIAGLVAELGGIPDRSPE